MALDLASSHSTSHFLPFHRFSSHLPLIHSRCQTSVHINTSPLTNLKIISAAINPVSDTHQPLRPAESLQPAESCVPQRQSSSSPAQFLGRLATQLEENRTARELHLQRCLDASGACELATIEWQPPITTVESPMDGEELRVAYQGSPGSYSEVAVEDAFPRSEAIPCREFEAAFLAVESWLVDRAVLPIENSLDGSIHRNYDLLLRHRLHIVGEVQWPVQHCLLTLPGVKKEELRRVISHPQALAHCEQTILGMGLNISPEAVNDTTGAAEFVAANNLRDTAVIASAKSAEIFGLNVLAAGIQDDPNNVTRFVTLAREPARPTNDRPYKTTVAFALKDGCGALHKAMSAFAFRGIRVTKLESRPLRESLLRLSKGAAAHCSFEYVFIVDIEASLASASARNALKQVEEFSSFFRILGSYPVDMGKKTKNQLPLR